MAKRWYFAFFLCLSLIAGFVFSACSAGEKESHTKCLFLKPHVYVSQDGKIRTEAEYGRLRVPENRSDPNSRWIEIAFVRFKSTSPKPGYPIVLLTGGPGQRGITAARSKRGFDFYMKLRECGDVVLFDQRGVGESRPALDSIGKMSLPLDLAISPEEYIEEYREKSLKSAEFWRSRGVDLDGYNTEESADDVNDLRQTLGAEKISILGGSYGSHLSFSVLRRHGDHIHRAVISSVEGPDHTIKLPSQIQSLLEKLHELALADEKIKAKVPDFLGLIQRVLEDLEKNPREVEVSDPSTRQNIRVTVSKFELQRLTAFYIGNYEFLKYLPYLYHAMSQGDFSWLAGEVLRMRTEFINSAMSFCMDCASGISPERKIKIQEEAVHALLGAYTDFPFPDVCTSWGIPELGSDFRSPVYSDVPTQFISGTLDGRTPVENAQEVMSGFSDAGLLVVENMAHSLGDTPEIREEILERIVHFLKEADPENASLHQPFSFVPPGTPLPETRRRRR